MPVAFHYFENYRLLHVDHIGSVSLSDLLHAFQELSSTQIPYQMKYAFNDFRAVQRANFSYQDQSFFANMVFSGLEDTGSEWKMSLLSDMPLYYAIIREYADNLRALSQGSMEVKAFTDVHETVEWLGVDNGILNEKLPNGLTLEKHPFSDD